MFLLTLFVGLSLAGAIHIQDRIESNNLVNTALLIAAVVSIATQAFAFSTSERRLVPLLMLVGTIAVLGLGIPRLGFNAEEYDALILLGVSFHPSVRAQDAFRIVVVAAELASFILLGFVLLPVRTNRADTWRLARGVAIASALFAGMALAAIYLQMLWLAPLPPNYGAGTNNYERLAEIAARVDSASILMSPTAFAKERSTRIAEAADLLEQRNFIPYDLHGQPLREQFNHRTKQAQSFRNLMRTIDFEIGAAITQGNHARACELALTNIRLGVMLQQGGSVIECLVGVAIQGVAQRRITEIRRHLSSEDSRRVVAALERALLEAEDARDVARRDRAMAERSYGWAARLDNVIESAGFETHIRPFYQAKLRELAQCRMLQTDLAIRLYQNDHGELPADLAQLVPTYLPEPPLDPYTDANGLLRYRPAADDFLLYSVGKDGRDNGGIFTNSPTYFHEHSTGYDYDLETHTRP
jgi:hypothetical protein